MANDLTTTDHAAAAFSAPSLTPSTTAVLDRAFDPAATFTAADIALIEPIAGAIATVQAAEERVIRQSIGALAAALPAQDTGEAGSKLKLNTYMAMLAGCDERALAYACRRCLDELDWMPTIHQLKERLRNWTSPEAVAISRARTIMRAGRRAPVHGDDRADLPDDERQRVNAFLRTHGVATRFAADGSTYQEEPAQAEAA
jgi:hypothetical protein